VGNKRERERERERKPSGRFILVLGFFVFFTTPHLHPLPVWERENQVSSISRTFLRRAFNGYLVLKMRLLVKQFLVISEKSP
jgi:hypothetical protein